MIVRALHESGLLKLFRILGMREYVCLLEHMIHIWDPNQQHFVVGTHIMMIDVEDIYFLIGLCRRRRPVELMVHEVVRNMWMT